MLTAALALRSMQVQLRQGESHQQDLVSMFFTIRCGSRLKVSLCNLLPFAGAYITSIFCFQTWRSRVEFHSTAQ
jgi:hypothetical protein